MDFYRTIVERVARRVRELGGRSVLTGDVPPPPLAAYAQAGIPSLIPPLGNLTGRIVKRPYNVTLPNGQWQLALPPADNRIAAVMYVATGGPTILGRVAGDGGGGFVIFTALQPAIWTWANYWPLLVGGLQVTQTTVPSIAITVTEYLL